MMRSIHLSWLFFLVGISWAAASLPLIAQFQLADQLARGHVKANRNSGLVVALIRGEEVWIKGYGQKSRSDPTAPAETDLFELGSLTHIFTALIMLSGQEEGRYFLEDPIQDHLSRLVRAPLFQPYTCVEIQDPRNPSAKRIIACSPKPGTDPVCITFCDLASHTSGLPLAPDDSYDWIPFLNRPKWEAEIIPLTRREFFSFLEGEELKFAPGTAFRYSNTGMALLGSILCEIHQQSFDSLLSTFVTRPLDMTNTRTISSAIPSGQLLPGHDHRGRKVPSLRLEAMIPAGGLVSNAKDLTRFVQACFYPSPLEEHFIEALQDRIEVHFPEVPDGTLCGYGWFSSPLQEGSGRRMHWQYGGTGGHRAFVALDRNSQTGVVLLANSTGPLWEMGKKLLRSLQP